MRGDLPGEAAEQQNRDTEPRDSDSMYSLDRQAVAPAMARSRGWQLEGRALPVADDHGYGFEPRCQRGQRGDGPQRLVQAPWTSPAPTIRTTAAEMRIMLIMCSVPMSRLPTRAAMHSRHPE